MKKKRKKKKPKIMPRLGPIFADRFHGGFFRVGGKRRKNPKKKNRDWEEEIPDE